MPKKNKEKEQQVIRIKLKSFDHRLLDTVARQIVDLVTGYGAKVVGPIPLPTEIKKFSVLRATFVHKDSQDQFEQRIHKRLIEIFDVSPRLLEALKNFNLPAGIEAQIKL
jgi:small subunit ribosomal protein S10